jgi:DnaJ-class molecular chaperone
MKPLENVDGISMKEPTDLFTARCPKCGGYGGWNLQVDAYGKGIHFQASCNQCFGWGWVKAGSTDETCVHAMEHVRNTGNCLNLYRCVKCGREHEIDSSD